MRLYKFRGKRVDNGEWIYGNLFIYKDSEFYIISNHDINKWFRRMLKERIEKEVEDKGEDIDEKEDIKAQ